MARPGKDDPKPAKARADAAAADGEEEESGGSRLGWIMGWIVVPGVVFGAIFAAGTHLGASGPDAWYTRFVLWVVELFA